MNYAQKNEKYQGCDNLSFQQSTSSGRTDFLNHDSHCSVWWLKMLLRNFSMGFLSSLQWRHNEHDGVSNHQHHDSLHNRLFVRRSRKTSKLRATGLCGGNSPVTGKFPAQRASYAENISIWWRHHVSEIRYRPVTDLISHKRVKNVILQTPFYRLWKC